MTKYRLPSLHQPVAKLAWPPEVQHASRKVGPIRVLTRSLCVSEHRDCLEAFDAGWPQPCVSQHCGAGQDCERKRMQVAIGCFGGTPESRDEQQQGPGE